MDDNTSTVALVILALIVIGLWITAKTYIIAKLLTYLLPITVDMKQALVLMVLRVLLFPTPNTNSKNS